MKRALLAVVVAAAVLATVAAAGGKPSLLHPSTITGKAPATFHVRFTTTKGTFLVAVHRAWAPRGADRFYDLVRYRFYDGQRLFRVVPGFVVQWGISANAKIAQAWANANIRDDRVRHTNARGTIVFADAGPNTRSTQLFVNLADNRGLDTQGFAPFGVVTSGFATLKHLYHGYGNAPSNDQAQLTQQGDAFVRKHFPKLDRILRARIVH